MSKRSRLITTLDDVDADGYRLRPGSWRDSEKAQRKFAEWRSILIGKALWHFQREQEAWGKRLYRGEGFTLGEWPELEPLTPAERTALLDYCKKLCGITVCTTCPRRKHGIHLPDCATARREERH